jgi:S1-C subfamily serine protease
MTLVILTGCNASPGGNETSTSSAVAPAALIAKRVASSLVVVEVEVNLSVRGAKHGHSMMTGIVYAADGLILTSASPVENGEVKTVSSINVILPDKQNPGRYKEAVPAVLVGVDKTTGIALLRVKRSGLVPARLSTHDAKVNEWIALISNMAFPSYAPHMGFLSYAQATVSAVNDRSSLTPAAVITLKLSQALRCNAPYVLSYEPFDAQGNLTGFTVEQGSAADSDTSGVVTVSSYHAIPAGQVAAAAARIRGSGARRVGPT